MLINIDGCIGAMGFVVTGLLSFIPPTHSSDPRPAAQDASADVSATLTITIDVGVSQSLYCNTPAQHSLLQLRMLRVFQK